MQKSVKELSLIHIFSNAVKYTPNGGHIRLEIDELTHTEHYTNTVLWCRITASA